MANTVYLSKTTLIGGATALDSIDGAGLADGDLAFVCVSGILYVYKLNATSGAGAAESSPSIISPDANAGDKRWILQESYPYAPMKAKAFVNFNGTGTVAIRDSYNVDSITDGGTGLYTINFTTPMVSANYAAAGMAGHTSSGGWVRITDNYDPITTALQVNTFNNTGSGGQDTKYVMVVIFGD